MSLRCLFGRHKPLRFREAKAVGQFGIYLPIQPTIAFIGANEDRCEWFPCHRCGHVVWKRP